MKKSVLALIIVITCLSFAACGDKTSEVDDMFMDSITENYGAECKFNMGDHQSYFDDGLQEYIGKGSFDKNGISYEYNYRAFIQDNTVEFVKISIFDENGNKLAETYDEEKETKYLDSLNE